MFRALLSPRLIGLHLLAVVATTAAVWLGLWQYDAWQTTREMQAADLANAEPKPLSEVMSADDPYPGDAVGQPVAFEGVWLDAETFLVSGRERNGNQGYWVVTPVAVTSGCPDCDAAERAPAMLVVRGWAESPKAPTASAEDVAVTGWLQPSEGSGDPDPDRTDDVLPTLRIVDVIQRLDQDLYGAYVIAEEVSTGSTGGRDGSTGGEDGAPEALEPVTPASLPEPSTFTSVRNLLYAFEWWFFGGFAVFLWWRWCRDEVGEVSTGSTPGEAESTAGSDQETAEVASSP